MTNENSLLAAENQQNWYAIIKDQLARAGFTDATPVPFYECTIPGENASPDTHKPPLLMPVVQPTQAYLDEHGWYGRYDHRSTPQSMAECAQYGFTSLEQEEGLPADNGVFLFEFFDLKSHFGLYSGYEIAGQMKQSGFSVTEVFMQAAAHDPEQAKLSEIANTIKNAAERTRLDLSHIDSKQWAAIFRHSESILLGTINLPDYKMSVISGVIRHNFPPMKIVPLPILHSIARQIHTKPVLEQFYHEPPAVVIDVTRPGLD